MRPIKLLSPPVSFPHLRQLLPLLPLLPLLSLLSVAIIYLSIPRSLLADTSEEMESAHFPQKIFFAKYDLVWAGILQELKEYELQYSNKIVGRCKTRWIDNTQQENFFRDEDLPLLASKFNLLIQLNQVTNATPTATKVTVIKGQQAIHQGKDLEWKNIASDGVTEETLFYRIDQFLKINTSPATKAPPASSK